MARKIRHRPGHELWPSKMIKNKYRPRRGCTNPGRLVSRVEHKIVSISKITWGERRRTCFRHCATLGSETVPQDTRLRVRFPVWSLDIFRWSTPLYTRRVELPAVPNAKVRLEAQHSIPPFSLHDLLQGSFTFMYKILGPP